MEDRENRSQLRCGIKLQFSDLKIDFSGRANQPIELVKAGAKASSSGGRNLESEYLAAGFSPRIRRWLDRGRTSSQK